MKIQYYYETENGKRFQNFKEALETEIKEISASREFEGYCINTPLFSLELYLECYKDKDKDIDEVETYYWLPDLIVNHYFTISDFDFFYIRTEQAFNLLKSIKTWNLKDTVLGGWSGEGWYDFRSYEEIERISVCEDNMVLLNFLNSLMKDKDSLKSYF